MMSEVINNLVQSKNDWLSSHVNVKFPTPESILGRDLYFEKSKAYQLLPVDELTASTQGVDEVYLVDFHRLTIMFALTSASLWQDEQQSAHIVEFLTQIILSDDFPLYVGFTNGEPVACAITHWQDGVLLVSDVALKDQQQQVKLGFISQVISESRKVFSDFEQVVTEQ